MNVFSSLFGGKQKQAPPVVVDNAQSEALATEQRGLLAKQEADLDKRKGDEERRKNSQLALLRALQGRGGQPTMFQETGARGVRNVLG